MRFFPTASCDTSTLPPFSSAHASTSTSRSTKTSAPSEDSEPESCPYLPPPEARGNTSPEGNKKAFFSMNISIGRDSKHDPASPLVDPEVMIFERMRDRLLNSPFAPRSSFSSDSQGSKKSLRTLNALLDSSYSQGYYDASLLPPPYLVEDDESKWQSHLSPGLANFASHYPLVTIAGLGVLAATTFFAAAGLTNVALKRMGSAGQVARKKSLDVRMDDLERRLYETLSAQSARRTAQIADLRGEVMRALSARGGAVGASGGGKGGKGGVKPSSEAPVASRLEEARLSQIITEALEGVMATRNAAGVLGSSVPNSAQDSAAPDSAEAKLDRITSLLEQIQRSLESSTSSSSPSGLAATIGGDSNVMSLSDISSAIRQMQVNTADPATAQPGHPAGTSAETLANELDSAAQSALPSSRRDRPTEPAEELPTAWYDPKSEHQQDIRRRRDRGTAAANQAHQERVDVTAHLSEAEKACRAKERGDMATRMKREAEDHAKKMKELMAKTFSSGSGAPLARAYQATRWEGMEENTDFSASPTAAVTPPAADSLGGRKEGLSGSESAARGPSTATSPPTSSSSAAPPPAPGAGKERPGEDGYKVTKPSRPAYGVDESGDWSFQVVNPASQSGWKEVPIVLRRSKSSQVFDKGQMWTSWTGESSYAAYSTRARIFFYPEADMIELDGSVWRCGREGGLYVIREKISEGEAK